MEPEVRRRAAILLLGILALGVVIALCIAAYSVGRFGVESLRVDTVNHVLGLRLNTITCTVVFIGAVLALWRAGRRAPEPQPEQPAPVDAG